MWNVQTIYRETNREQPWLCAAKGLGQAELAAKPDFSIYFFLVAGHAPLEKNDRSVRRGGRKRGGKTVHLS